jgi:hypothetical protein
MNTKELLELINDARLVLNKRVKEAKKAGKPDDELAELDDRLLHAQEQIMEVAGEGEGSWGEEVS